MTDKPRIIIDMVADPLCPWCYVGKRALDRVLMALSFSHDVVVRYRPYQLAPDTPQQGVSRRDYLERKFPDAAQRDQMAMVLKDAARHAGLDFDPALPALQPNSLNSLRLWRWSHYDGLQIETAEGIFAAYWKEGADIGSPEILAEIAQKVGLDADESLARLQTREDVQDINEEVASFRAGGVDSVPTYIVNESAGFAGALPPDQLLSTIRDLAAETPV